MQSSDRAGYLEHLARTAGRILHEGELIRREHQGFGFEDGLRGAWQCHRRQD
jgi:hypothetical protein